MNVSEPGAEAAWRTHLRGLIRAAERVGRRRVWLVSYPRSGNTLMREYLAILQGRPQLSVYPNDVVEPPGPRLTDALDRIVMVKSHQWPSKDDDAVVYLVRDGRNATLSFLYLACMFGGHTVSRPADICAAVQRLDQTEGSWAEHVRTALAQQERRPLLILRFEDLIADPAATLVCLASFLGATLPLSVASVCVDQQRLNTTYDRHQVSGMRVEPEPDSLFALLKQNRRDGRWREILDAAAKRHMHLSGATEFLLRFGYDTDAAWWQDGTATG